LDSLRRDECGRWVSGERKPLIQLSGAIVEETSIDQWYIGDERERGGTQHMYPVYMRTVAYRKNGFSRYMEMPYVTRAEYHLSRVR
jgi:hypothetical protein